MLGGFTNYAHLRLRDHRPGNGEYELPPEFGPSSSSSKRSILSRHFSPQGGESCSIGPGGYTLPSTLGAGRSTRFGPPLEDQSDGGAKPTRAPFPNASLHPAITDPKQYSMALSPDTPSYSIYGRLDPEWVRSGAQASPGPAAYNVLGEFDRVHGSSGAAPGAHMGARTGLPEARAKEGFPGPGAYNLVRFGDEVPRSQQLLVSARRRGDKTANTPGPGAYDDTTSIGYRADKTKMARCFTQSSTFGGRWQGRVYRTPGPGPAAYNTLSATKLLERNQRHAPKFAKCQPPLDRKSVSEAAEARLKAGSTDAPALQSFPTLPSDFDYNYKKGKTIGSRIHVPVANPIASQSASKAAEESGRNGRAFWESPPPPGGRFAATPYDPSAIRSAAENAEAEAGRLPLGVKNVPGPGAYDVDGSFASRHVATSLFGQMVSSKYTSMENGVPGPGHYNPVDDSGNGGVVFYKGDFHPRGDGGFAGPGAENAGGGPGAHYNDGTMYSCSINGDRASSKGFTMGIRYPARATYQHCSPYDETTNINCVYPDELTWESQPSVQLPSIHRSRQ